MGRPSGGYHNPPWFQVQWNTARLYLRRRATEGWRLDRGTWVSIWVAAASCCLVLLAAAGFLAFRTDRTGPGSGADPAPPNPPLAGGRNGTPTPASSGGTGTGGPGVAGQPDWGSGAAPTGASGPVGGPAGGSPAGLTGTTSAVIGGSDVPGGIGSGQPGTGGPSGDPWPTPGPSASSAPSVPPGTPPAQASPTPTSCPTGLLSVGLDRRGLSIGLRAGHDQDALLAVCR